MRCGMKSCEQRASPLSEIMSASEDAPLCFPQLNNSCRKMLRSPLEAALVYGLLSCITLLTVVLNLLVIISISRFRQLQTSTNLLLLSLAVSDFMVGFLQMPVEILLLQGCWMLRDSLCAVNYFLGVLTVSVSVGNMVLISVDRYVAICDPMLYVTKVTVRRVRLCICLCWLLSVFHTSWMLRDFLRQPGRYNSCYGECVLVINVPEGAVDLVTSFFGPFLAIIILYVRVFVAAVSQARAMRTHPAAAPHTHPAAVPHTHPAAVLHTHSRALTAKRSEMKAARTLGVVVVMFLLCSSPYYSLTFAAESSIGAFSAAVQIWLLYLNSCVNPLIYAFLYPWFRKSVRTILTSLQPTNC